MGGGDGWQVIGILEAEAPVAKVGREDEDAAGGEEVRGQEAGEGGGGRGGEGGDKDGDEEGPIFCSRSLRRRCGRRGGKVPRKHLVNIRQMHLQTVLVGVRVGRHGGEFPARGQ